MDGSETGFYPIIMDGYLIRIFLCDTDEANPIDDKDWITLEQFEFLKNEFQIFLKIKKDMLIGDTFTTKQECMTLIEREWSVWDNVISLNLYFKI